MADESEDDDCMHALGFMFDAGHSKEVLTFDFRDTVVRIKSIGENPGHKQSGQYVWPASKGLAEFLIDHKAEYSARRVLELGSGCGIGGIVAAKVLQSELTVMTDYDPGTLTLIADSVLLNQPIGDVEAAFLQWGKSDIEGSASLLPNSFDLILGADLIYSKDVVEPLFQSVSYFLDKSCGRFLLVTSFMLGEGIEQLIDEACQSKGLRRECLSDGRAGDGDDTEEGKRRSNRFELYTFIR